MPITRPYRRSCRQFTHGDYTFDGEPLPYILHPKYANSSEHYVRAFFVLSKDVQDLFDYIEPSDKNCDCYSYRTHELLLRLCIEVEANCKAILRENDYTAQAEHSWNMNDYQKIEHSHYLSGYQVKFPFWQGTKAMRSPFANWRDTAKPLPWYQAYNKAKHDRHNAFSLATFEQVTDAFAGLLALLSSQFYTHDFSPGNQHLAFAPTDGMEAGIGNYLRVKFPEWPATERYDFAWDTIEMESDPFQNYPYA